MTITDPLPHSNHIFLLSWTTSIAVNEPETLKALPHVTSASASSLIWHPIKPDSHYLTCIDRMQHDLSSSLELVSHLIQCL